MSDTPKNKKPGGFEARVEDIVERQKADAGVEEAIAAIKASLRSRWGREADAEDVDRHANHLAKQAARSMLLAGVVALQEARREGKQKVDLDPENLLPRGPSGERYLRGIRGLGTGPTVGAIDSFVHAFAKSVEVASRERPLVLEEGPRRAVLVVESASRPALTFAPQLPSEALAIPTSRPSEPAATSDLPASQPDLRAR